VNFLDIQRHVFQFMGRTDETLLQDWERQQVRDDINLSMDEALAEMEPYFWRHMRESSFTTTAGTGVYTLDDRVVTPTSFWTEDTRARHIPFIDPREMDINGNKNSVASTSWADLITWYPGTTSAGSSGAAGATAGVSVSNGATTVTKSGGTAFASADVGKLIRLNNEIDIEIASVTNDNELEITQAYRGRLSGTATTNSPGNLSQVAWEISPLGRYRIQTRPAPSESETVYYRYARKPDRLLNDTDIPDLPEKYHNLLVYGAIMKNAMLREKQVAYQMYGEKYAKLLDRMRRENDDALASKLQSRYLANSLLASFDRPFPPDTDTRRRFPSGSGI
jgi:hypothetical protein